MSVRYLHSMNGASRVSFELKLWMAGWSKASLYELESLKTWSLRIVGSNTTPDRMFSNFVKFRESDVSRLSVSSQLGNNNIPIE